MIQQSTEHTLRWGPSGAMLSFMASKKAPKKASGRNISESERNTEAVKVRIHPVIAAAMRHEIERPRLVDHGSHSMSKFIEHAIINRLAILQSHKDHMDTLVACGRIDQAEADRRTIAWKEQRVRERSNAS